MLRVSGEQEGGREDGRRCAESGGSCRVPGIRDEDRDPWDSQVPQLSDRSPLPGARGCVLYQAPRPRISSLGTKHTFPSFGL